MVQAVALMCVFGMGVCFSLLGSISVKLMPRLNIDQGKFGTLISFFMFSCLIGSLIIGFITDAVGYKWIAVLGFVLTGGCIIAIGMGKNFKSVLWPCMLFGLGAMAMNTAGNVMAPQVLFDGQEQAAASNLANVFFGIGLFLTPLGVSFLFRKVSYEKAISVIGVVVILPVIIALFAEGYPQSSAKLDVGAAVGLLGEPAVLVAAFVLFCYMSLETSFCNWLPSYGKEVTKKDKDGIDDAAADASGQQLLSFFAIAMMLGRLAASLIPGKVGFDLTANGGIVIAGAALVIGVVVVLMMGCATSNMAKVLAVVSGLAFGPCFPTTIGVTFSKFSSDNYGSIFGIIFAIGITGAVIVPKLMGDVAKGSSIQKSLKLLIPACVLLVILAIILGQIKGAI